MSLRPQAHDIITFWLFNTVVKSQLHYKKNPWKDVTISGFVLDPERKKMSKSKGNVIEPQEVIEKYSADALRYWASSSKLGEDLSYQEKDIVTGKKFITKLLNSSRFVFMNLKDYKPKKIDLVETDRIFLIQLNKLIETCTKSFDNYSYFRSKLETDNFFWSDFCANYLELVKNRVYNGTKKEKESAFYTLYYSLLTLLKLFAPITPFITEEIYQNYFRKNDLD
ncbi:MAG: class I tRNA ligase family protein [Candidatus Nanoarchaeia archaeon]